MQNTGNPACLREPSSAALGNVVLDREATMQKIALFLKGILMGLADVVPGVSGGTIAFVLGIYPAFMAALASINFRWIYYLIAYVLSGFKEKRWEQFKSSFFSIHWLFLLTLLSGMASALLLGAAFIPGLMDEHPSQMRAFFFGLVLASIMVPFAALQHRGARTIAWMIGSAILTFFVLGLHGAPPHRSVEITPTTDTTIRDLLRQHPSTSTAQSVLCTPSFATIHPELASTLRDQGGQNADKTPAACRTHVTNARNGQLDTNRNGTALDDIVIPAGTPVQLAAPTFWFIFLAGAIAICAMVLPGISGSFILLILGAYTFVFSSVHATQLWLMGRGASALPVVYIGVFGLGVMLGVMVFSRVVTYLFKHYTDPTLGALIGIMVGSMRVLWPFQVGSIAQGTARNVLPSGDDPVFLCMGLTIAGFLLVVGLARLSKRLEERSGTAVA